MNAYVTSGPANAVPVATQGVGDADAAVPAAKPASRPSTHRPAMASTPRETGPREVNTPVETDALTPPSTPAPTKKGAHQPREIGPTEAELAAAKSALEQASSNSNSL